MTSEYFERFPGATLGADVAAGTEVDPEALAEEMNPLNAGITAVHPPSLPYAGSSGWSGSEASRERAEERDSDGRTTRLQSEVERYVSRLGVPGATIAEAREAFPEHHHGSLSGTLTALHKDGRLLRLTEKRGKCSVYINPRFLLGREAVPPKTLKRVKEVVLTADMDAEYVGHLVIAALNGEPKVIVRGAE